jgi:hypothetical protein
VTVQGLTLSCNGDAQRDTIYSLFDMGPMLKPLIPKKLPETSQAYMDDRQSERLPGMTCRDRQISTVRSGSIDSYESYDRRSPLIFQPYGQSSESNIRHLDNIA